MNQIDVTYSYHLLPCKRCLKLPNAYKCEESSCFSDVSKYFYIRCPSCGILIESKHHNAYRLKEIDYNKDVQQCINIWNEGNVW